MNRFLLGLITVSLASGAPLAAEAFEMSVTVDTPEYVRLTDSGGKEITLEEGTNYLSFSDDQNPFLLSGTDHSQLTEVIHNGDWRFPAAGPHSFIFADGDYLKVYSKYDDGNVTLAINGNPAAAEIRVNGEPSQIGMIDVKRDALVEIIQREGYIIDNVSLSSSAVTLTHEGDTWSFTASRTLTVDITSHQDVAENVKINVDNATNMTVRDALGTALPLADGDNLLNLDPETQSPLTVTANPGAEMVMAVINGKMIFPNNDGVYTLTLDPERFNEIYLISQRNQTNTITINVDDASRVSVSCATGPIELKDGSNFLTFDFDNGNPITITAREGSVLRGVAVDYDVLQIVNNSVSFYATRGSVIDISTGSDQPVESGWILLVDEDFSGMTQGTEDEPDVNVQLFDDYGYALPSAGLKPFHESCTQTWGGDRLYPAGGSIAVMGGFLNTPIGDFSGDLKMTFRARLVPNMGVTRRGVDVMLIRHSRLDEFKRETYTLTPEWQEFSFTADNGWFYDTKIQFFNIDDLCYEIDDVRIEHRITGIEPPVAALPDILGDDAFIAEWFPTETADEYLLSVYEKGPSLDDRDWSEDFEEIETDGTSVVSLPEGWSFNLSSNGDRREFTDNPEYTGSGTRAICFDANGDFIVTPKAEAGIKEFSFFLSADTSDPDFDPTKGQVVAVGALTDVGWHEWMNISVPALLNMYDGMATVDLSENLGVFDNIYALRIESVMNPGERILLYIDDVHYTVAGQPELAYLLEDKVIEGQDNNYYIVEGEGFDPEADYFYNVKARNSKYTSVASNEIEVFNIHTPKALEPTDVTADSFTANWTCGGKADNFVVTLYQTMTARETGNTTVLHETFSKAKGNGTPFDPENGYYNSTYVNIDHLTDVPGWKATSYSTLNGMAGGLAEDPLHPNAVAGAFSTPTIDLSHDNGNCRVKVRGWFHAGDGLVIQGTSPAAFAAVPTNVEGEYEIELDLSLCGMEESLTIYSPTYSDFMLDEVTITQNLEKGDRVKVRTSELEVPDKETRSLNVTGLVPSRSIDYSYDVYANRYFHGDPSQPYKSLRSNETGVKLDLSGTDTPTASTAVSVAAGAGHVIIVVPEAAHATVNALDGTLIADADLPPGATRIDLPAGIHLIRVADRTFKMRVR